MRFILLAALLSLSTLASAFECATKNPYSWNADVVPVCHTAYQSYMSMTTRLPVMVRYEVTPEHSQSCNVRVGTFTPDPLLDNKYQATHKDYTSGSELFGAVYDIGHMAPAEDMKFDDTAEAESFYFTNAIPQTPLFNRGIWKTLELKVRSWALSMNTPLEVYAGAVGRGLDNTGTLIRLPTKFYKVVVNRKTKEAIIFVLDQQPFDSNFHPKLSDENVVSTLPQGVTLDLTGLTIRTKMWGKGVVPKKSCN